MKSGRNESTSEAGVGWARFAIAKRLRWIFREHPTQDKGVDAHVEEVVDDEATGRLIGMQIKSGESWMREKSKKGFVYRGDFEHLTYWRGHSLPILIVLFDPDAEEAYWELVSEKNIRETDKGWSIVVPFNQRITSDAIEAWTHICSPEAQKAFLRKKRVFSNIAFSFETEFDRRQTLLYEALHHTSQSLLISTPYISEGVLAVLDFMSLKCPIRLIVGSNQSDEVWRLIRARTEQKFEVRICPNLHAKKVIFDSVLFMDGSANLTPASLHHSAERFCLTVNESQSEEALASFFRLWDSQNVYDLS